MMREIKDFLSFSRLERAGLSILLAIVLLLILANIFYDDVFVSQKVHDFSSFEKEMNLFFSSRKEVTKQQNYKYKSGTDNESKCFNPFFFNPNNLTEDKWQQLGLNEHQIKVIKNYEEKGGRFYSKNDIKKMYCISDAEYKRLEPWIQIPGNESGKDISQPFSSKRNEIIELNSADTNDLMKLPGVGPYMAGNIIKYRGRLGGFSHIEQLRQVYRMSPETYNKILTSVIIDTSLITPCIKINSADFYELLRHPYIDKPLAYNITAYRHRYGKFKSVSDIRSVEGVNDSLWLLLRPYLKDE